MISRIKEVYLYRGMLRGLVASELRTRYKGSVLGFLWTFVNPLLTLVIYSLVFAFVMRVNIPHYTAFLFIGLLSWNYFAISVQSASSVIVRQASIVKKIYFPREILPLAVVGGGLVNYLLSLLILIPFLILRGFHPTVIWVYFPISILVETILTVGIALMLSALNVYFRDLEHMVGILMMLWFYLTPVLYSLTMIPAPYDQVFKLNPMAGVVLSMQRVLFYGQLPHWKLFAYSSVVSCVVLVAGWFVFMSLNRRIAEEV